MRLFRSIGCSELETLFFQRSAVIGRYHYNIENQSTCNMQNAVSFFIDEIRWKDSEHIIFLVLDIPVTRLEIGVGQYNAEETLKKSHIWDGESGPCSYGLREAYTELYSLADVREIYLFDCLVKDYQKNIESICKENNIIFHANDEAFIKYGCNFVSDSYYEFDYISEDFSNMRDDIVLLTNNEKYVMKLLNTTKSKIMEALTKLNKGDKDAIALAVKLQKLLP